MTVQLPFPVIGRIPISVLRSDFGFETASVFTQCNIDYLSGCIQIFHLFECTRDHRIDCWHVFLLCSRMHQLFTSKTTHPFIITLTVITVF